jgi:hypothetical protein
LETIILLDETKRFAVFLGVWDFGVHGDLMLDSLGLVLHKPLARYGLTVAVVTATFLLWCAMVRGLGLELPTFISFYQAIFLVSFRPASEARLSVLRVIGEEQIDDLGH